MTSVRYRPIVQTDRARPESALSLAGGPLWFEFCERLSREEPRDIVRWDDVDEGVIEALVRPRAPILGLAQDRPHIVGVLNVTPDSFSDGGHYAEREIAVRQAMRTFREGASVLDIGGESTRPGAAFVDPAVESARVVPVIERLRESGFGDPVSIDTRKSEVAAEAIAVGANMLNDVSALEFDPGNLELASREQLPVCLMHAQGDPKTMQDCPVYSDVLLDVYGYLEARVDACVAAGLSRDRLIIDPGIGFGKTAEHNLEILRGVSLFHGLGCPVMVGVSRKRFIGTIGQESDALRRFPGSIAVGLEVLRQGVQFIRVHDIAQTRQAIALWRAML